MKRRYLFTALAACVLMSAVSLAGAETAPARVLVYDQQPQTSIAGPGAPRHIIGLPRTMHNISLDTGVMSYVLRYIISKNPEEPTVGIPGEGYIGMPGPADANWYSGGFFDLKLNGESIGTTMIHSFSGRAVGNRGYVDYVFDAPQAVVRLRMVALAGGDCLYAQLLLDPKEELTAVTVAARCYPSGFLNLGQGAQRHVLTPTRTLKQGERVTLDNDTEWWLNYYDNVFDLGVFSATASGSGPCSLLWLPEQAQETLVNVGSYNVDTALALKPELREYRFIFFDQTGMKNADAQADLQTRAPQLLQELADFPFIDQSVAEWSLDKRMAEVNDLLAALPADKAPNERYEQWSRELADQLRLLHEGNGPGAIMAEARALQTVIEWERSLPDLRLEALLNSF